MLRPLLDSWSADFERVLLRKGVGELLAGRSCCQACGRTPLTGELVHLYPRGRIVCALCRLGERSEPERTQAVPHAEHGQTVRLRPARAA